MVRKNLLFIWVAFSCFTLSACRFGNKTVEKKENNEFPPGYYEIASTRMQSQPTAYFQYCAKVKSADKMECRDPLPNDELPGNLVAKIYYNPMGIQTYPKDRTAMIYNPTLKQEEVSRYAMPAYYDSSLNLNFKVLSAFPLYHPNIPSDQSCNAIAYKTVTGKAKKYDSPIKVGSVEITGAIQIEQTSGNEFDQSSGVCQKTLHYYKNCYEDVGNCFDANDHDLFVEIFQPYIDAGAFAPYEIEELEKFGFQVGVQ